MWLNVFVSKRLTRSSLTFLQNFIYSFTTTCRISSFLEFLCPEIKFSLARRDTRYGSHRKWNNRVCRRQNSSLLISINVVGCIDHRNNALPVDQLGNEVDRDFRETLGLQRVLYLNSKVLTRWNKTKLRLRVIRFQNSVVFLKTAVSLLEHRIDVRSFARFPLRSRMLLVP